ncbi:MAG: glycosyltransferase family 2 protein [Actinobacteria bacterium]|nr:glycosyltransferase family 2 protein [Actinomycetota bacterium]
MITGIVLAKNEEKNIIDCLECLDFCSEIIVIDDFSDDRTEEISKAKGAKVFKRSLNGDFSSQRNFGLSKAKEEWIIFLDPDERISDSLKIEILENIKNASYNGFLIKRRDVLWGRTLIHGETGNIRLLRVGRKGKGLWEGKVHEKWNIDHKIGELNNSLIHLPHQTMTEFLKEINFYTDLRATELKMKGIKATWFSIIAYPKGKFFLNYVLKLGFLDGLPGLVFAITMSFHSFLVRGKLWFLWKEK